MNSDRFDRLMITFITGFLVFVLAYLAWQLWLR